MSVSRTARSATEEDGGWRKACGWAGRGHMRAALRGRPWTFSAFARRWRWRWRLRARVVGTRGRHEVRTARAHHPLCLTTMTKMAAGPGERASAGSRARCRHGAAVLAGHRFCVPVGRTDSTPRGCRVRRGGEEHRVVGSFAETAGARAWWWWWCPSRRVQPASRRESRDHGTRFARHTVTQP
jgi:hypothetical protein